MNIEEGRIVPGDLDDKCVCSNHFSDSELQGIIQKEGLRGTCSYCVERGLVMDMPDFITMVKNKLEYEFEDVDNAMLPLEKSVFDDDEEDITFFSRFHGYAAPSYSDMYEDTEDVLSYLFDINGPE